MENIIIVAIVAVCVIFGVRSSLKHFKGEGGCCGGGSGTVKTRKKKLDHVEVKKRVVIEGMMCENCQYRVERSINAIPGVASKVNWKKKEAIVSMEHEVADDMIRTAVEKEGYQVIEISLA